MIEFTYLVRHDDVDKFTVHKFNYGDDMPSQSYSVSNVRGWSCNCPHNTYRRVQCKHINYVKRYKEEEIQEFDV